MCWTLDYSLLHIALRGWSVLDSALHCFMSIIYIYVLFSWRPPGDHQRQRCLPPGLGSIRGSGADCPSRSRSTDRITLSKSDQVVKGSRHHPSGGSQSRSGKEVSSRFGMTAWTCRCACPWPLQRSDPQPIARARSHVLRHGWVGRTVVAPSMACTAGRRLGLGRTPRPGRCAGR